MDETDEVGGICRMRASSLGFFYLPSRFPHNLSVAFVAAILFALTITSFVPMGAIFPTIEPNHKGAAISVQNLGGGLSNFVGPAIVTLLLPTYVFGGIVIVFGVLYFIAAIITLWIKVDQPVRSTTPTYAVH